MTPCECCGQRLPGEPRKAELAKRANEAKRVAKYHTDRVLALGLRAEGVPEREIAKIRGLYVGNGIWGRRLLRAVCTWCWAPGMVERHGRSVKIHTAASARESCPVLMGWEPPWRYECRYGRTRETT